MMVKRLVSVSSKRSLDQSFYISFKTAEWSWAFLGYFDLI